MGISKIITSFVLIFIASCAIAQPGVSEKVEIEGKKYYKHLVKSGETVYSIHNMYKVDEAAIYANNPGSKESIAIGQYLLIPVVTKIVYESHVVARRETIFGICKSYNIKSEDLLAANPELK